jgi:uncharacterized small protein (DUF1192 family)
MPHQKLLTKENAEYLHFRIAALEKELERTTAALQTANARNLRVVFNIIPN